MEKNREFSPARLLYRVAHCITEICGIPLGESFIRERLIALDDDNDHMTRKFIELYGREHWKQTKTWFNQALKDEGRNK